MMRPCSYRHKGFDAKVANSLPLFSVSNNNGIKGEQVAKTSAEIIADHEKKIAQIKARIQAEKAREISKDRKLDTRRKVILGGLLLDAAKKEPNWNRGLHELLDRITRDNDRKAFADFTPPAPPEENP